MTKYTKNFYQILAFVGLSLVWIWLSSILSEGVQGDILFWGLSGVSVAWLVFSGLRFAPLIFLCSLVYWLWSGKAPLESTVISIGNVLGAATGAWIFKLILRYKTNSSNYVSTVAMFLSAFVGAIPSALFGGCVQSYFSNLPFVNAMGLIAQWYVGDFLGIFLLMPLASQINYYLIFGFPKRDSEYRKNTIIALGLLFLSGCLLLSDDKEYLFFLTFFPIIFITEKLSFPWTGIAILCTAILELVGVAIHQSSWTLGGAQNGMYGHQFYLLTYATTCLIAKDFQRFTKLKNLWGVLVVGWLLSALVYVVVNRWETARDDLRFNALAEELEGKLVEELRRYEDLVQGGVGLFEASDNVRREEWAAYVDSVFKGNRYPGVRSLGFVEKVAEKDLSNFIMQRRKEGVPDFQVKNLVSGRRYAPYRYIIKYIEPLAKNRAALGVDNSSESNRKEAADFSAKTGVFTVTKTVYLSQDQYRSPAIIGFAPIYAKGTKVRSEENLVGWVSLPIVLKHFLESILNEYSDRIEINVYGSREKDGTDLLFSSIVDKERGYVRSSFDRVINFGQKEFYLSIFRGSRYEGDTKLISIFSSCFLSLTFLLLLTLLLNSRLLGAKARFIAEEKTKHLNVLFKATDLLSHSSLAEHPEVKLLELIHKELKWSASLFWKVDKDNGYLQLQEMLFAETVMSGEFKKLSKELLLRIDEDYPGKTWKSQTVIFEPVIPWLPEVPRAQAAHSAGFRSVVTMCLKNADSVFGVYEFYAADKKTFSLGIVATLKELENRFYSFLESEKIKLKLSTQQKKMIENAKMSSLGEMAGGLAHELNNPLAIIGGYAALAKNLLGDGSKYPQKVQGALGVIEETTERMAKVIRGLRLFSRDQSNENFVTIPFAKVVENACSLCQEKFRNNGVLLEIKGDLQVLVELREMQMSQVILNLLMNSFEAIVSRPSPWVKLEASAYHEYLVIRITDSGSGISPDVADKMMQPFFTTKEVGRGTGLGLSIAHGIVSDHNGKIELDATHPNTSFVITLPLKQPKA